MSETRVITEAIKDQKTGKWWGKAIIKAGEHEELRLGITKSIFETANGVNNYFVRLANERCPKFFLPR